MALLGECPPHPHSLSEQMHDGEEVFLSEKTWDGFIIATAVLNVTFKAK